MKILCVGRNYAEHAKELGNAIPTAPVIFLKPQNALLPPGKDFYIPEFTKDLHYEAELVIRICRNGKHIAQKFARKYYDQITLGIDFTARDLQQQQKEKGLPWEIAKAFDASAPIGRLQPINKPVSEYHFELLKNGTKVQDGDASHMLHNVDALIAYCSQYFSLNQGDLLFTGTPAGVGPVAIGDKLEGFIEGEQVLELNIR
jgi:2-keto-4-pentenoate hydratase/2-oxohepta-3-ene-1,7-dioic acid hydratase in catechol pathway